MEARESAGTGEMVVPVSIGDALDKITILEIKMERLDEEERLRNVREELRQLRLAFEARHPEVSPRVAELIASLKEVNSALWEIEDELRDCERRQSFGEDFVELARAVYRNNDRRAALKREINLLLNSRVVEEKSYRPYG